MVKSIINEMLEMTYPDDYYKNVIEPAKLGKAPIPSMGQMLMKSQPFKAVSLPFQEMINPGKFGSFRSSGTPMARAITGPLSTAVRGLFSAPAAGIMTALTPTVANADEVNMTAEDFAALNQGVTPQNEPMDIEDFLGTSTPQDLGFIGMAPGIKEAVAATGRPSMADIAGPINENLRDLGNPFNDSRIASEEQSLVGGIPDRGRGMPGEMGAYEMVGGTPVAVGDVLGMQQALEKADFYEEPTTQRNLFNDLLGLASLAYTGPYQGVVKGANLFNNIRTGKVGKIASGLGSLGTKISGKMRGINPITGRPNTQAQYEQARADRQAQSRTDAMIDRITSGKRTRSNPRDAGTTDKQKADISAAMRESRRGQQYTDKDSSGSGGTGGGKIVCTMMNERYGFGSFRNKIWMKFHESYGPEYQKGYHAIFLPLVKIAKGEGKINTAVRKVLEHMGRHVTADMFKIMKGKKRDTLGRIYRAIFEPACHIIGKIKSALGRG
jgi:hypothetical protein